MIFRSGLHFQFVVLLVVGPAPALAGKAVCLGADAFRAGLAGPARVASPDGGDACPAGTGRREIGGTRPSPEKRRRLARRKLGRCVGRRVVGASLLRVARRVAARPSVLACERPVPPARRCDRATDAPSADGPNTLKPARPPRNPPNPSYLCPMDFSKSIGISRRLPNHVRSSIMPSVNGGETKSIRAFENK